jgi:hypothetical protein
VGLLNNTVSICQYRVLGQLPEGDAAAWAGERLAERAFRSIEESSEELSIGWVHLDDTREGHFASPVDYHRDPYLTFTLRRDQRRVPPALLRAWIRQAEREFLDAHPGLQRVPKGKREELREAVHGALLARTLPAPAVYDAVWDIRTGLLTLATLNSKVADLFEDLFKRTFEGLRLVALHPFDRALAVVGEKLRPSLQQLNGASSDDVLSLIRENRWLGREFLLWLMHRTMNESSEYAVAIPGLAAAGTPFVAYLNDRLVLVGGGDSGLQKIAVSGPQDHFREVRVALQGGKEIQEAVLYLERGEHLWRLNLKGELFHFASFKAPAVRLEKDAITDPGSEQQALFFERMAVLEEGLQLFDSLLALFLAERLDGSWPVVQQQIAQWLEGE